MEIESGFGSLESSIAPAPSDNIQRKKSFSKAITGFCSNSVNFSASLLNLSDLSQEEIRSDPVQTASFALFVAIAIKPYFSAFIPEVQMPFAEFSSIGLFRKQPWTIVA